ncbi:MAG TPA: hypothetical protein VK629_03380 [Steroidobacteraceae bacterium]|nr:hypothetical protein [Steroidobacteraceae bacterium]
MKKKFRVFLCSTALAGSSLISSVAAADVGLGLRAGTLGFGADFDIGLGEHFSARIAYNYLDYEQEVEDTDITYDGTLEISSVSGYLDWHPFAGGFRVSLGAVGSGPKIKIEGRPAPGEEIEINGRFYDRSEIGSLNGEIKTGNSIAPYIGIGYGNVVGKNHRLTFLFDLGAIYGGKPDVNLTTTCGSAFNGNPAGCNQLRADVEAEQAELETDTTTVEWWPVINIGIGIRF